MDRQYQLLPKGGQAACLGLLSLTNAAGYTMPSWSRWPGSGAQTNGGKWWLSFPKGEGDRRKEASCTCSLQQEGGKSFLSFSRLDHLPKTPQSIAPNFPTIPSKLPFLSSTPCSPDPRDD